MDPFVAQLACLCTTHRTRAKWVFVPSHAIGRTLGDRLVLEGTDWANLRFVTPLDIALLMGAPFLVERGIDPSEEELGPALMMRLLLELPLKGGYFRPLADHPTLAQALWATVRELRMSGIGPEALTPNVFSSPAKHAEIVALLSSYERFLAEHLRADMAAVYKEALRHPELFAFKQSGGWFSLFQDAVAPDQTTGPVYAALAALGQYYRWTRVLPAAGALERVLEASGYLALAATTPGGVDAGDLAHAVDRVRQVVEDGASLADAADALDADREATSEVESLPLEPGRTDVVRLMNLHKAKGLEANVVFLADSLGGVKPRADVHIERTELHARGWLKLVRKSEDSFWEPVLGEHADWSAHEAAELPYVVAEEDRLLYVAATRARHVLVVSQWIGNADRCAWRVLDDCCLSR